MSKLGFWGRANTALMSVTKRYMGWQHGRQRTRSFVVKPSFSLRYWNSRSYTPSLAMPVIITLRLR